MTFIWIPQNTIDGKSIWDQVLVCCLKAPSHYLIQCSHRFMKQHCVPISHCVHKTAVWDTDIIMWNLCPFACMRSAWSELYSHANRLLPAFTSAFTLKSLRICTWHHNKRTIINIQWGAFKYNPVQNNIQNSTAMTETKHRSYFNSSPSAQNGHLYVIAIFRWIFANEKFCILIKILLNIVPKGLFDNNLPLV